MRSCKNQEVHPKLLQYLLITYELNPGLKGKKYENNCSLIQPFKTVNEKVGGLANLCLLCQDETAPVCSAFWNGGRIICLYLRTNSVNFIYKGNCFSRQVDQVSARALMRTKVWNIVNKGSRNRQEVSTFISFCEEPDFIHHINYQQPF